MASLLLILFNSVFADAQTDDTFANDKIIISREQLLSTGITDVGQLLQRLPYFNGSPIGTHSNQDGDGSVRVDLRGLGTERTLILIDGNRTIDGGDFQSIPAVMIERVEISKQGSQALYGSGAMAGMIDIITRKDFTGTEIELSFNDSFDTDSNDVKQASLLFGQSFSRGHFVMGLQYEDQQATKQSDTPYAFMQNQFVIFDPVDFAHNGFNAGPLTINHVGSNSNGCGVFNLASSNIPLTIIGTDPASGDCGTPGRTLSAADFREFNGDIFDPNNDTFNATPFLYVQTPYEKANFFFNGQMRIGGMELSAQMRYNDRKSAQQFAPPELDSQFDPVGFLPNGGNGIEADNYFNPFGEDVIRVRKRIIELDKFSQQDVQQYQAIFTLKGHIPGSNWSYQGNINLAYKDLVTENFGQFSGSKLINSVAPAIVDANGNLVCFGFGVVNPGCVPLNLFGSAGTITAQMLDYISKKDVDFDKSRLQVFNMQFAGDLFNLPAGTVNMLINAEYREQKSLSRPEILPISIHHLNFNYRSTHVSRIATQLNLPIFKHPTNGRLDASLSFSIDDHSVASVNNSLQSQITYQANNNFSIHATFAELYREPTVAQLFSNQINSFPFARDLCNTDNFTNLSTAQQGVCLAQGVPAGGVLQPDPRLRLVAGGNPNLKAEMGRSKTIGIYWNPASRNSLHVNLDWWKLDIENAITSLGFEETLLNCLNSQNASSRQCQRVRRRTDASIIDVFGGAVNEKHISAEGLDFAVNFVIPSDYGDFNINFQYSKLLDSSIKTATFITATASLDGRFTQNQAYNQDKAQINLDWNRNYWNINYRLNYLSDIDADLQLFSNSGTGNFSQHIASQSYSDLALAYAFSQQNSKLTVGITNLFDRDPPFIESGLTASTQGSTYQLFGRSWFVKWNSRF
jgi:outer membrane receptor protein involved in Fe transport